MTDNLYAAGTYQIEPELRGPLPRRVRERPHMIAAQAWFARVLGILLCVTCYLTSTSLRGAHDYLRHQQAVTGTVDEKRIDESGETTKYNVVFSYEDLTGESYSSVADVGYAAYQALRTKGPISVYFSDADPSDWQLSPVTNDTILESEMRWYGAIALVTLASLGGLGWFKGYRLSRIRLLQNGEAAVATVTARNIRISGSGDRYHSINYKWKSPRGKWRATSLGVSAKNYAALPESTRFTVICVPGSEFQCVPYFTITEATAES